MTTTEQRRRLNAAKQKRYRERKKAALSAERLAESLVATEKANEAYDLRGEGVEASLAGGEIDPSISIKVKKDDTPKVKPGLMERLGLQAKKQNVASPKKPAAKKPDKPNLMVTVMPTMAAAFIAAYARDRIPEEYKPCAPTPEEVRSMIGPLFDIIGRRVEIAAQASQDAIDLTNSIICMMAYSVRAYVTYVDIKKAKEVGNDQKAASKSTSRNTAEPQSREPIPFTQVNEQEQSLAGGMRGYQTTNAGAGSNSYSANGSRSYESGYGTGANGADISALDDTELRDREAALMSGLLARDSEGRRQRGLF